MRLAKNSENDQISFRIMHFISVSETPLHVVLPHIDVREKGGCVGAIAVLGLGVSV